jgi:hypothetical protein
MLRVDYDFKIEIERRFERRLNNHQSAVGRAARQGRLIAEESKYDLIDGKA